jgi:hypothetical protein
MRETGRIAYQWRKPMSGNVTVTRLKIASGLVIFFGILIALGAHPATAWPSKLMADLIFWPLDGAQSLAAQETRLMFGIAGGVMCGWGAMLWLTATRVYATDPALARLLVMEGIGIWFVVDCAGSLAAGAPLNVLFNLVFLAVFLLLLLMPQRTETA